MTASKSIREVLPTSDAAANTDGSLFVANSLAHHLDFSLCASSTNLPHRIFALVVGFCSALTLLTRRHAVLIRFGSPPPLHNSSSLLEVFPVNLSLLTFFLNEWNRVVCHYVACLCSSTFFWDRSSKPLLFYIHVVVVFNRSEWPRYLGPWLCRPRFLPFALSLSAARSCSSTN